MDTLRWIYVGFGVVMILLSFPLVARKVPPNRFFGVRTRMTLDHPDLWYEMNAYEGKLLLVFGVCLTIAAFGLYWLPGITQDGYAAGYIGVLAVVGVLITVRSTVYHRKLRARNEKQG
jgi:hypothetical protein